MLITVLRFSMNEIENNYETWQFSFFGVYIPQPDKDLERNGNTLSYLQALSVLKGDLKMHHANFDRF